MAIQALKNNEYKKEPKMKKQTFTDRIKEIEFRKEGDNQVFTHLGYYFGDYKFEFAKRGFSYCQLLKWKMEKKIYEDLPSVKL